MEFVWASVLFIGVAFTVEALYEYCQLNRERTNNCKRTFYPLNFEKATGFHFIKDQNEEDSFNVFDSNNLLVFRIYKRSRQKSVFKEKWVVVTPTDENELASVTMGCMLSKNYVSFNLINRYSNPSSTKISKIMQNRSSAQPESANIQHTVQPQMQTAQEISEVQPSEAPSSRLSPVAYTSSITPYVDSSLAENSVITKQQLGKMVFLQSNTELKKFEERKLYKVYVNVGKITKTSSFKISKNSMKYSWKANGYLEKSPKDKSDYSCERIGIVRFKNANGSDFWLYVNEGRIEPIVGVTTAFLQYKKSMWKYKDLLHLS